MADESLSNPALVQTIEAVQDNLNEDTNQAFVDELVNSNLLVAVTSNVRAIADANGGEIPAGTELGMVSLQDDEDREHIALFTDWDALNAWKQKTGEDLSGLELSARQAFNLVRSVAYASAVINPATHALPLNREAVEIYGAAMDDTAQ